MSFLSERVTEECNLILKSLREEQASAVIILHSVQVHFILRSIIPINTLYKY